MNQYSFNTLTEPWLPVITLSGKSEELGILDCLERAHELKEIRANAPIVEFGMYRLLTAFVLDMLISAGRRPEIPPDLKQLLREGKFDIGMIRQYVEMCGDVFDLFHPERPFLQTKMGDEPVKALAGIFPAVPSGSNANFWHHKHEGDFSASSSEAARLLTTIAPFMTAGGSGFGRSINGDPPLYVLVIGNNLYETIIRNLPLRQQGNKDGLVAWRNASPPGKECPQISNTEGMTWRPRKILLIPEKNEAGRTFVKAMKFSPGAKAEKGWIDSSVAYCFEKEEVRTIQFRENRSIWRDAGPLLLMRDKEYGLAENKKVFRRPGVVENFFETPDEKSDLVTIVYGMRVANAKVYEWIKSILTLPYKLGYSTRLGYLLLDQQNLAVEVANALGYFIKLLHPCEEREIKKRQGAQRKKKEKRQKQKILETLRNTAEHSFWEKLEPSFYMLMKNFADLNDDAVEDADSISSATSDWRRSIQRIALEQFEKAAKDMDADSDALARLVNSRTRLRGRIIAIIGEVV